MAKFEEKDNKLSQKLRMFCDSEGKEIFPAKAGHVFNELGLLYRTKSPDKISLIQSAALLNAAIVRQPLNKKYRKDLEDLCKHVLQCSAASQKKANLIEISKQVKEMILEMREQAKNSLKSIKPIEEKRNVFEAVLEFLRGQNLCDRENIKVRNVVALNDEIAQKYTKIMSYVSRRCIEIMGTPPCKYSVVGMGSLARKEITPFSDFEHIIVLEDLLRGKQRKRCLKKHSKRTMAYFRWYSVIFHIIVINLQETIIPNVCIPSLNDCSKPNGDWFFDKITPRGISFDGMMPHACKFPLGRAKVTEKKPFRTELIKSASQMAKYLNVKEDLKNGYHLANILTKTCFVAGSEEVYKLFCEKIMETQQQQSDERQRQVKEQLQEDLQNFNIAEFLKTFQCSKSLNVKQAIYRSVTLFVSALGQLHNCFGNYSNFEILESLRHKHVIDNSTFHDLSLAVAIACHVRLYQYTRLNTQGDSVLEYSENFFRSNKLNFFLAIVSKQEFVKFFSSVLRLQMLLADDNIYDIEKCFSKKSIWPKLAVKMFMALYDEVINEGERYLDGRVSLTDEDLVVVQYVLLACLENVLNFLSKVLDGKKYFSNSDVSKMKPSTASERSKSHKNALTKDLYLKYSYQMVAFANVLHRLDDSSANREETYCILCFVKGVALVERQCYHEALSLFRDHISSSKQTFDNSFDKDITAVLYTALTLHQLSLCFLHTDHPEKSLHYAFECLELFLKCGNIKLLRWKIFDVIAKCYSKLTLTRQEKRYREMFKISRSALIFKDYIPFILYWKQIARETKALANLLKD